MPHNERITKALLSLALTTLLILSVAGCASDNAAPSPAETTSPSLAATPSATTATPPPEPEATPEPPPVTHNWREANYQEPKTDIDTGETEGEPLPAQFEGLGYTLSDLNTTYPYHTVGSEDTSAPIIGELTVSDLRIFESDETLEAKEGFEWRAVNILYRFSDANATSYGAQTTDFYFDYYSFDWDTPLLFDGTRYDMLINFKGEDYMVTYENDLVRGGWEGSELIVEFDYFFSVPVGYDGVMLAFVNSANYSGAHTGDNTVPAKPSELIDADTLYFRLAD